MFWYDVFDGIVWLLKGLFVGVGNDLVCSWYGWWRCFLGCICVWYVDCLGIVWYYFFWEYFVVWFDGSLIVYWKGGLF